MGFGRGLRISGISVRIVRVVVQWEVHPGSSPIVVTRKQRSNCRSLNTASCTLQFSAVQCSAVQCSAVQQTMMQCSTVLLFIVPQNFPLDRNHKMWFVTIRRIIVQCSAAQLSIVRCCVAQYSTVQCSLMHYIGTVQCDGVQCSAVQCSTTSIHPEGC